MQLDIAETIREHLSEFNPINLYGIGTLRLVHESASFGEGRESLLPPSMNMEFIEEASVSNASFIQWMSKKYKISTEEADISFKRFCVQLLNALVNYGKVNLKGVAFFKKDGKTKSVECLPNASYLSNFYKDLPQVPVSILSKMNEADLNPVIVTEENKTAEPIVDLNAFVDSEQDFERVKEETVKNVQFEQTSIDNTRVQQKEILKEPILNIEEEKTSSVLSLNSNEEKSILKNQDTTEEPLDVPQWSPEKEDSIFNIRNISWILALVALLLLGYFGCKYFMSSGGTSVAEDNSVIIDSTASNTIGVDTANVGLIDSNQLLKTTPSLPEKCIIITGSFKKTRNAIKMQDLLLTKDLEVYKEVYGEFTRVGFKFECKDVDLENYLQDIRRNISKFSWYLDPSLYVEYE